MQLLGRVTDTNNVYANRMSSTGSKGAVELTSLKDFGAGTVGGVGSVAIWHWFVVPTTVG